jgi:two-component system, LytTR family, response regulator
VLRAVIIDDEQPAVDMLKILLEETGKVKCVGECRKPSEAAGLIAEMQPDAVFLDIEMPGINGIELATDLLDRSADLDIIFVTAFNQYAVAAFELNAVDYLLKPALPENVERAVARLLKLRRLRSTAVPVNAEVQIRCFGKLEVRRQSTGSQVNWRTAKVEELFAFLLYHHGTIVRKGKIIETLWPECGPNIADNNLHTSVYQLKKTFKENRIDISVRFAGGGYVMDLSPAIDCDVAAFENFVTQTTALTEYDIGKFETVADLYQGDYLEGKDYLWCLSERARLQKYFAELTKQAAHWYINTANFVRAERILLRNIGYLPYDEDAYELLLKVCSLRGDRPGMMKYYETIQTALYQELGIEPRPSLKRLYENLINDI